MRLKVVLEPSDEGGFTVYVPSLPGCISEGETVEEALANIREAVELYLEPVDDDLVTDERTAVREIEVCARCHPCPPPRSSEHCNVMDGRWFVSGAVMFACRNIWRMKHLRSLCLLTAPSSVRHLRTS